MFPCASIVFILEVTKVANQVAQPLYQTFGHHQTRHYWMEWMLKKSAASDKRPDWAKSLVQLRPDCVLSWTDRQGTIALGGEHSNADAG